MDLIGFGLFLYLQSEQKQYLSFKIHLASIKKPPQDVAENLRSDYLAHCPVFCGFSVNKCVIL